MHQFCFNCKSIFSTPCFTCCSLVAHTKFRHFVRLMNWRWFYNRALRKLLDCWLWRIADCLFTIEAPQLDYDIVDWRFFVETSGKRQNRMAPIELRFRTRRAIRSYESDAEKNENRRKVRSKLNAQLTTTVNTICARCVEQICRALKSFGIYYR